MLTSFRKETRKAPERSIDYNQVIAMPLQNELFVGYITNLV